MYNKIALLKLCCPGDLLFTTPAVRALKSSFPEAELSYITGRYSSFIPEHNRHIARTIIVEPPYEAGGKFEAIIAFVRGISRIAKSDFGLFISFHRSGILASLGLFGKAEKVVGFSTAAPMVNLSVSFDPLKHEVLRYLDLVSVLGCQAEGMDLEYLVTPEEDRVAHDLLAGLGIDGDYAVIAPGGGENPGTIMHIKRWPVSNYARVAKHIKECYNIPVIAIGSKSEKDLGDSAGADINLAGRTTFPVLAAVLKKASIVIANDSGPLYLASAVGARTVGIYGPSSDDLVAPCEEKHRSVRHPVWCQPCYRPENVTRGYIRCSSGTWACMLALQPEKVCEAVDELLGGEKPKDTVSGDQN
jgi:ADP-heptose:LPS heptosyltransferase